MPGRTERLFASPSNPQRKQILHTWKGAIHELSVDWNAVEQDRSTTATSTQWETDDDTVCAISGATLSAGIAEVAANMGAAGTAELKNTATFADGTKAVRWFNITVKDDG